MSGSPGGDDPRPASDGPFWRQRWFGFTAVLVVLGVVGAISSSVGDDDSASPAPDRQSEEQSAGDASTGEAAALESSTYVVPTELEPGVYRVAGYWARLDGALEIIDNGLVDPSEGFTLVVVTEGDSYLEVTGEVRALPDLPRLDPTTRGFTDGTYLVGNDIQPGRYRVTATAGGIAYAARLDDDLDTIDSDLDEGSVIMDVDASDFAFAFKGTLELTG